MTEVIDLTPKWWQRNRLIQRIRHHLRLCEGFANLGRECPLCRRDVIKFVNARHYLAKK